MIFTKKRVQGVSEVSDWWQMHFADRSVLGVPNSCPKPKEGDEISIYNISTSDRAVPDLTVLVMRGDEVIHDRYPELAERLEELEGLVGGLRQELEGANKRAGEGPITRVRRGLGAFLEAVK